MSKMTPELGERDLGLWIKNPSFITCNFFACLLVPIKKKKKKKKFAWSLIFIFGLKLWCLYFFFVLDSSYNDWA